MKDKACAGTSMGTSPLHIEEGFRPDIFSKVATSQIFD